MNFWRAMAIGGYVLGWLERASRDGKITLEELTELATYVAGEVGVEVEIPVPAPPSDRRQVDRREADRRSP